MPLHATQNHRLCTECREPIEPGESFEAWHGEFFHAECINIKAKRAEVQQKCDEREFAENATPAEKNAASLPGAHPL